jgi:hypothetical protein
MRSIVEEKRDVLAVEEKRDALAIDVFMLHYSRRKSRVSFILFGPVH